jgi:predicted XRE-type DNA-binding protein
MFKKGILMNGSNAVFIDMGSTNVYADLDYPDAAAMQRKSELVQRLVHTIEALDLTQEAAAARVGVESSELARVVRGQFREVDELKLLEMLACLGHEVSILVGPVQRRPGRIALHIS